MKRFEEFPPPACLATFVRSFWCYLPRPSGRDRPASDRVRILPDGCIDLIVGLRVLDESGMAEVSGITLSGPTDHFVVVGLGVTDEYVGVRFRPGMAGPVLGVHAPELFRRRTDPLDYSRRFVGLSDRLEGRTTAEGALRAIEGFLIALAEKIGTDAQPSRIDRAVALIGRPNGATRVGEVARAVGISERTLHRDILATVGLSPKILVRNLRFRRTLDQLRSPKVPDLCLLALANGYADQSHMNRDFLSFSGITPTTLRDGARSSEITT